MEKLMNQYDKKHMRLAMLKHEEVFREQVVELHRLYQTQKNLMKNIQRSGQPNQKLPTWDLKICKEKIQGLDLERPSVEESNKTAMVDESELLELTLGPSSNFYRSREVAAAPLSLLQLDNYSGTSLSSSSSSNNKQHHHHHHHHHHQQQNMTTSRQKNNNQKWRVDSHVPLKSNHRSFLGQINNGANNDAGEENLRQNRSLNNSPSWLFQVLSLKMT